MPVQEIHKVCPTCGGEFQARLDVCPDCDLPLLWSTEASSGPSGAWRSESPGLEPSPDLVGVRTGDLGWVRSLAARLAQAGIRSFTSIVADPSFSSQQLDGRNFHHDGRYHLFVRPEDLEASEEMDREMLAEQFVEAEALGGLPALGTEVCPACGAHLPEGAKECASCELRFDWPGAEQTDE